VYRRVGRKELVEITISHRPNAGNRYLLSINFHANDFSASVLGVEGDTVDVLRDPKAERIRTPSQQGPVDNRHHLGPNFETRASDLEQRHTQTICAKNGTCSTARADRSRADAGNFLYGAERLRHSKRDKLRLGMLACFGEEG
jgi:hypothetical protein